MTRLWRSRRARMMSSLEAAQWLTAEHTRKVVAALEAVRPGCARFVGGCVRNALMQRPVDDIDIATQLLPDQVMAAMEAADIRVIPTGLEHGTVTAICDSEPFEITTLRRDVETDGRRAVVAFTEDWREDAMRRDFRLNALYAEPDGTLHDPVSGGLEDAALGRVIFIGDADERLREDYLRILRFFRFNAWYGAGFDADGLAACQRQREGLRQIAAERIWKEFKKLLAAPDPSDAVVKMDEAGVLEFVVPGTVGVAAFADVAERTGDASQRFMALVARELETVSRIASKLRLSNRERERLEVWAKSGEGARPGMSAAQARAFIYHHGAEAYEDSVVLHPDAAPADVEEARARIAAWKAPRFPLGGEDALSLGLRGEAIGKALRAVELEWVDSDFTLARDALLTRLKALAA